MTPDPAALAETALRLEFLDAEQAAAVRALPADETLVERVTTEGLLSVAQVWAALRKLARLPCRVCGEWSPVASTQVGAQATCQGCGARSMIPSRLDPQHNRVGEQLGAIALLDQIGEGGLGTVYRGWHGALEGPVAVKVLTKALSGNQEYIQRFRREAKALSRIEHENVVRILDVGEENGSHYLAMELLEGQDLASLIKQRRRLPPAQVIDIARQAACGLAAVHAQQLAHRDLKPANLMWVDGRLKLIDLGLAKGYHTTASFAESLTQDGMAVGTPVYMAPEQCRDEPTDGRADLYALGLVMYSALAGQPPFYCPDAIKLIQLQISEPLPSLRAHAPGTPEGLVAIVRKLTQKAPSQRYQSAWELLEALQELDGVRVTMTEMPPMPGVEIAQTSAPRAQRPAAAPRPGTEPASPPRPPRRRPWVPALCAVVLLAGIGGWLARRSGGPAAKSNGPSAELVALFERVRKKLEGEARLVGLDPKSRLPIVELRYDFSDKAQLGDFEVQGGVVPTWYVADGTLVAKGNPNGGTLLHRVVFHQPVTVEVSWKLPMTHYAVDLFGDYQSRPVGTSLRLAGGTEGTHVGWSDWAAAGKRTDAGRLLELAPATADWTCQAGLAGGRMTVSSRQRSWKATATSARRSGRVCLTYSRLTIRPLALRAARPVTIDRLVIRGLVDIPQLEALEGAR